MRALNIELWWDGFLGINPTKQGSGAIGTNSCLDTKPRASKFLSSLSCVFLAKVMDVTEVVRFAIC
jgi:hypothetical protein